MRIASQTFTRIFWKQLYYPGAAVILALLAWTAWGEGGLVYHGAAVFLAFCALISLWQFIVNIREPHVFTLGDDGITFPGAGLTPWSAIRRIQNIPAPNIVFFIDGQGADIPRARKTRGGLYEKNCTCRGMNVPVGMAMHALQESYRRYLMRIGAGDQARKISDMFAREPLF